MTRFSRWCLFVGIVAAAFAVAGCLDQQGDADRSAGPVSSAADAPAPDAAAENEPGAVAARGSGDAAIADPPAPADDGDAFAAVAAPPADDPPGHVAAEEEGHADAYGAAATGGEHSDFDPVAANGPVFKGWGVPKLALVISGEMNGYLEPCGCAGLENMKGGLARRHTLLEQLRGQKWPVAAVDMGGMVRRFGKQPEMKYHTTIEILRGMGYDAIGLGPGELRLGIDAILVVADESSGFVSANVALLGFDGKLTPRYRVVERGGYKLGITQILGKKYQRQVGDGPIQFEDAAEALAKVVPEMKAKCDFLLLMSHATVQESTELAKKFPNFDMVVTAGGATPPPAEPAKVEGTDVHLLEVGQKGMYLGVFALFDDAARPWRFQRVPVDARYADAPETRRKLDGLQGQYQQIYERSGWEGLGLKPIPHPKGQQYVGSAKCGECHETAHGVYVKTPHSHATETLMKLDPPRHFDPECISCHSTGWEPQKYFPFAGGYLDAKATPLLKANGCENCHGPGSRHVAVEEGELEVDEAEQQALRMGMRLTLERARDHACGQCHDLDNSPDYVKNGFEAYWPKVEHKGKY